VSTSAQPAAASRLLTTVPLLAVASSVPAKVRLLPCVIVGASLTAAMLSDALAAWLEYAVVPPPTPGLA
jgi:hypothetical protein